MVAYRKKALWVGGDNALAGLDSGVYLVPASSLRIGLIYRVPQ